LRLLLSIRIIRYINEMIQSQTVAPHLYIFPEPYILRISLFMPWLTVSSWGCDVCEVETAVIVVFIHTVMNQLRPLQMIITRRDQCTLKTAFLHDCQSFRSVGICAGGSNFFYDCHFKNAKIERKLFRLCVMLIHSRRD